MATAPPKNLDVGNIGNSLIAATVAGTLGQSFNLAGRAGKFDVLAWRIFFPGTAPNAQQTDIQVCDGDPTDENQWYTIASNTNVTKADPNAQSALEYGTMPGIRTRNVRAKLISVTTPGGGISADIYVS